MVPIFFCSATINPSIPIFFSAWFFFVWMVCLATTERMVGIVAPLKFNTSSSFKHFQGLGGATQRIYTFAIKQSIMEKKIFTCAVTFAIKQSIMEKKVFIFAVKKSIMVQMISPVPEYELNIYIKKRISHIS